MIINEIGILLKEVRVHYPNMKVIDPEATAAGWYRMLKDETLENSLKALDVYLRGAHEFAPNSGQILDIINQKRLGGIPTPQGAWLEVKQALRNSGYHAEEEFEVLHPLIKKVVGRPATLKEWAMATDEGTKSVIQNRFIRAYEIEVDRARENPMEITRWLNVSPVESTHRITTQKNSRKEIIDKKVQDYRNELWSMVQEAETFEDLRKAVLRNVIKSQEDFEVLKDDRERFFERYDEYVERRKQELKGWLAS